jgi:hypothetical protein
MENIVLYTAVTKGYDQLLPPPGSWLGGAAFVAFLDEGGLVNGWEQRRICSDFSDPCRNAKIHKIVPHRFFKDAQYSLWIDGNIRIKSRRPLREVMDEALAGADLALFRHRKRQCAYDEAEACILAGKDNVDLITRQMARYRSAGYKENNGLGECCVIFRRHTPEVERFNEAWYSEICEHSRRDQLSFNYTAELTQFRFNYLTGLVSKNDDFERFKHLGVTIEEARTTS